MKTTHLTIWAAAALLAGTAVLAVPALHAGLAPATQPATQPAAAVNTKCPVSGDDIDAKVTTVYNGKTYAFCCADCIKSFNKDPEKYASKAK
jgi:YHS domain-containing protein